MWRTIARGRAASVAGAPDVAAPVPLSIGGRGGARWTPSAGCHFRKPPLRSAPPAGAGRCTAGPSRRARALDMTDKRRRNKAKKRNYKYTAATADKHELYQLSVQDPEIEIAFINRVYKKTHGRLPVSLREDFCGTALFCAAWAK